MSFAVAVDKSIELVHQFPNERACGFGHTSQSVSDWNKPSKSKFLKHYLHNDISLCLEGRVRFGEMDSEYFYAVFRNLLSPEVSEISNQTPRLDAEFPGYLLIRSENDFSSERSSSNGEQGKSVLVLDVEFVHGDKEMVFRRGAEVRLLLSDQIYSGGGQPIQAMTLDGRVKFLGSATNRELVKHSWGFSIVPDQGSDQMVEAGAKVMNDLAGQDREAQGNSRIALDYERILKSVFIKFTNDFVWFGIFAEKSGYPGIEIADCLICPFEFGRTSV